MLITSAPLSQGSLSFEFKASTDGVLLQAEPAISICLEKGILVYRALSPRQKATLECEDITNLQDGKWHSFTLIVDEKGSRIYIDGYQEFCGTSTIFLSDMTPGEIVNSSEVDQRVTLTAATEKELQVRAVEITEKTLSDEQIVARAFKPIPLIQFAANELSAYDVRQVSELHQGSILVRFRVRGRGQDGTILAASNAKQEVMRLNINETGITYSLWGRYGQWRNFQAQGSWTDGKWHDLAVIVGWGAVEIYMDGFRQLHAPGQAFFAHTMQGPVGQTPNDLALERVVIGQDTKGRRLFGEASQAYIYDAVLNDSQIKAFSQVKPLRTQALFDRGFQGAASYRIPSLLTLPSGVVIAGADRRNTIPNDSPNDIDFVIRRSTDGGESWEEPQTVGSLPGTGLLGASYTDSALLYDERASRVIALLDLYPGGYGQPNDRGGIGLNSDGQMLVYDAQNNEYTIHEDGSVWDSQGKETAYSVDSEGYVSADGKPAGNIYLHEGTDPDESLLCARTSFLVMFTSDDEGVTWQGPVHLNHQVKAPWMGFLGVCPGNGIQLRTGSQAGRLVVPVYFSGQVPMRFTSTTVYSDDGGKNWSLSLSPNEGRLLDGKTIDPRNFTDERACLYESSVVERSDGDLVMFMRNQHPSAKVAITISKDAATSWQGVEFHSQLPEIFSQPNAINVDGKDLVVFANASQLLPFRGGGVLRLSTDGGRSFVINRTFRPFHYVYQCLTVLPKGDLGLLWEHEWQGLYFTQIPMSWFEL